MDLPELTFRCWKDSDTFRLRKVVMVVLNQAGELLYRQRYWTALFPLVKRRAALRRVERLLRMAGKL